MARNPVCASRPALAKRNLRCTTRGGKDPGGVSVSEEVAHILARRAGVVVAAAIGAASSHEQACPLVSLTCLTLQALQAVSAGLHYLVHEQLGGSEKFDT